MTRTPLKQSITETSDSNNNALKTAKKVFKHDTEAGRLLSRLYGVELDEPEIKYPKLKSRGDDLSKRCPWNQKLKEKTEIKVVKVPKVGQHKNVEKKAGSLLHVSSIPRRKTEASCKESVEEIYVKSRNYRPPNKVTNVSDVPEKERLSEINAYGGGNALPNELTMPKQNIPPSETKRRQHLTNESDEDKNGKFDGDMLTEEIIKEIEDRRKFQIEMEKTGKGDLTRDRTVKEISDRMTELMRLDSSKANKLN